jgi:iron complex transport system ATP-binding protein
MPFELENGHPEILPATDYSNLGRSTSFGSLSQSAMVGAVQVVTEAKSGVLRDHGVLSCQSSAAATGTGTDAVVIACSLRGQGAWHIYSGTHTVMGALIGQVVTDCVTHGLAKARAWQESHQ